MNLLEEIKYNFTSNTNAIRKIIVWNVGVFLCFGMIQLFTYLTNTGASQWEYITRALMLPASFSKFLIQPWSLITYLFSHENFFHILFNMLWLYLIGNLLHEYLGNRKVYEAYFVGGIFGGLIYMICYNLFPVFENHVATTFALGASAGVLAVVAATATLLPDYGFQLLFFGNVKLKWIALISIALDLISIPNGNAGGHIAHLGGAAFGFFYIKFLYKRGGHLLPDWFFQLFTKKSNLKIYHKPSKAESNGFAPSQMEVDAILDKISKSGYDSLSKKEKEILFKASKD